MNVNNQQKNITIKHLNKTKMTSKEKAKELVNKFLQVYDGRVAQAKVSASILADEMIQETKTKFWYDVKHEIENL